MTERARQYLYKIYGLTVAADGSLGEFGLNRAATGEPDVRVGLRSHVAAPVTEDRFLFGTRIGDDRLDVFERDGGWLWLYPDDCRFWISHDTRSIRCAWPPSFSVEDATTYLLGPILGFVLRRRGVLALHASTVQIDGHAVALMGKAGAGKSTITAELLRRGHGLVSEDVSALDHGAAWSVRPGLPFVKLWQDSAALHGDLPPITPNWDKRFLATETPETAARLDAVVLLEEANEVEHTPLAARDALVAMLDNVYVAYALTAEDRAADLGSLAPLAESLPAWNVTRTQGYDDLAAVCDLLEGLSRTL